MGSSYLCLAGAHLRQFYSLPLKEALCVNRTLAPENGRAHYHPCPVIPWSHGFQHTSQGCCEIKGMNGCKSMRNNAWHIASAYTITILSHYNTAITVMSLSCCSALVPAAQSWKLFFLSLFLSSLIQGQYHVHR